MKRLSTLLLLIALVLAFAVPSSAQAGTPSWVIPTFSIVSVSADNTVTIRTYNFPKNDTFNVLMNYMGTRGVNGIKVDTVNSEAGGTFTATYNIPNALKGQYRIAIRLESPTSGYFAYNWFYNNTTGTGTGGGTLPGGSGTIPTFSIIAVERNKTVTIRTNNFPKNDTFNVLMNYMGTRGVNGIKAATVDSGSGGTFTATFDIPAEFKGEYRIAIRLQSPTSGYYAFNWFYNNTTGTGTGGGETPAENGYRGYPTFSILSVVRDQSVTVQAYNLPPNDTFRVTMGPMGTRGINGYFVTSFDTGSGGNQQYTFNIPAQLAGSYRIAIRMQSPTSGYFAYNWFYNNTTN